MDPIRAFCLFLSFGYIVLNRAVWKRARGAAILPLLFLLYFYTLHAFVIVGANALLGVHFEAPFFLGPFFARVDDYFWQALAACLVFTNLYLAAILLTLGRPRKRELITINIEGWRLWAIGNLSAAVGIFYWARAIGNFYLRGDVSGYFAFKAGAEELGSLYAVDLIVLAFGSACLMLLLVAVAEFSPTLKVRKSRRLLTVPVILSSGVLFVAMMALGDRVTIMEGGSFAITIALFEHVRLRRFLPWAITGLVLLNGISFVRKSAAGLSGGDLSASVTHAADSLTTSAEAEAPLSLYLAMRDHIPPYGAQPFRFLAETLVPQFIQRRETVNPQSYFDEWCASITRWKIGHGFHYATDWYLSMGLLGIGIGAILLGMLHGLAYSFGSTTALGRFVFAAVVAGFPIGIRSGIVGIRQYEIFGALALFIYALAINGALSRGTLRVTGMAITRPPFPAAP